MAPVDSCPYASGGPLSFLYTFFTIGLHHGSVMSAQPPSSNLSESNNLSDPELEGAEHEKPADVWPLEAGRMAIDDPLVDCLRIMAGHYGRRTSKQSLTAGMPIGKMGITPMLFTRAAERTGWLRPKLRNLSAASATVSPDSRVISSFRRSSGGAAASAETPTWGARAGTVRTGTLHPCPCFRLAYPAFAAG